MKWLVGFLFYVDERGTIKERKKLGLQWRNNQGEKAVKEKQKIQSIVYTWREIK